MVITGTDGKTTVTTMVTEMFRRGGIAVVDAGNNDLPLVSAIADPGIELFVVEASSFRLGHTASFRPRVGTWLNFAADHVDNHGSLERYEAAKARLFAFVPPTGTAVVNLDDPVVAAHRPSHCRVVTVSTTRPGADYHVGGSTLRGPGGDLIERDALPRALPHDVANALAAAATALEGGAPLDAVQEVLGSFRGLPHRVALVAEAGGIAWYDDSKATTPHATSAAVDAFDDVVLIAGGRNKGIDLAPLAATPERVRAVVAIGEAAPDVAAAFAGCRPVETATSMDDAVARAAALAHPGDAVLLSPGCASFDWYSSYGERGDDFARAVRALTPPAPQPA